MKDKEIEEKFRLFKLQDIERAKYFQGGFKIRVKIGLFISSQYFFIGKN